MKCHDCNTTIKKKNKTRHELSKKHKFLSDLILNKNVVKDIGVDRFKDVITSYFNKHIKNLPFSQYLSS